jgi:hypothetical protein
MPSTTVKSWPFADNRVANPSIAPPLYPLQRQLLVWGFGAAGLGGVLFWSSPLIGFAFLVLLWAIGALWRRGEPPILVFGIAYQWLFVVTGYVYYSLTGTYPSLPHLGNLSGAVFLSLLGFLVLVAGIRTGFYALRRPFAMAQYQLQAAMLGYDVRRLFEYVIALYTINWFVSIAPMGIFFNAAQIIYNVLAFRSVFLFVLLLVIVEQQTGYRYAVGAFLYVLIPQFASMMSHFKELFFLLVLALFREWRPWSTHVPDQRRSLRIVWTVTGITVALLAMGVFWEGGVKPLWRPAVMSGQVSGSPTERLQAFVSTVMEAASGLKPRLASKALVARLSSGVGYFSHVLEHVPDVVPHENGHLILRALGHMAMPRFLFPEKPNLGGDSWLVWKYAGIRAADERQETSVGLGYMAECYIDFGIPGMFVPIFLYGVLIGLAYQSVVLFSPSCHVFHSVVTVIFLQHFVSYEGEIAKLLGGLAQTWLIFMVFLHVFGTSMHRHLLARDQKALQRP